MDQRNFENGKSRFDALDVDGGEVAALLSALPRVEAPQNFDFRVKAGIAAGPKSQGWFLPMLKIAAPASLLILIVAFVVFYGSTTSSNEVPVTASAVDESVPVAPSREEFASPSVDAVTPREEVASAPAINVSGPQVTEDPIAPERASVEPERRGPVRRTTTANTRGSADRMEGGSVDLSLGSANTRMPKGFESVSPTRNTNADIGSRDIPVSEVLQMLGIGADFGDGGWKVRSVSANTMAHRAGVRTGDVLEAINGRQLTGVMSFKGEFGGKSLSVRRDGKSMMLVLNK